MAYEAITYDIDGHVATLTFNRPERMNALGGALVAEFGDAYTRFKQDAETWVLILTGAGDRAFSAGADLKERADASSGVGGGRGAAGSSALFQFVRDFDNPKPIIAAVNGYALGGGLEVALACDIIVAADHARLGLPEVLRGIIAGAGGVHRLPRQMPLKIAMGYMLTGKHMTAQEALRWGLVNEVVPLADLLPTARRWAADILANAPLAVRASKEATVKGLNLSLDEALAATFPQQTLMSGSEDAKEGALAFAEKRAPRWLAR